MAKKKAGNTTTILHFPVVGIGASAGGLDAFKLLLKNIPKDSGMAYIIVQHLHPDFESNLAEILQRETAVPVIEITNNLNIEPDHIYIIPPNKLLLAANDTLKLIPRGTKNELNRPIDIFFTSIAEVYQADAIGIVLSGLGSDGTLGLKKIKEYGGISFAQEISSSAFDSMPNNAINAGVVDFVLKSAEIPAQLMHMQHTFKSIPLEESQSDVLTNEEDNFKQILALLRVRRGVDFTYYKQSTIRRRILRRMVINKIERLADYLQQLRSGKPEQDLLYQDLLIPVTSFFRDTATFEHLCENLFPELLKNKSAATPLRIWVAGCSTGEEAYSIGICLYEYLGEKSAGVKVQIFATDISEKAITKARTGIYNKRELENVSEQRLQEYFNKIDGSYQVKKIIRDMCVFASHNFLKDSPFARIDLVCCRNVLIYMESYLQKKALNTFHYALVENGFLLLGKSETTSNATDLFASTGKNEKLYTRKSAPSRFVSFNTERKEKSAPENNIISITEKKKNDFQKNADDILLERFSPAGVVLNEQFDIVQFRGSTREFIEALPGKASLNIFKMVKEGLAFEIRNALHKAKLTTEPVIKENIPVKDGELHLVNIEVIPLLNTIESHYLVLFTQQQKNNTVAAYNADEAKEKSKLNKSAELVRIQQLERELLQLREDIRSITEDQEAANEELQSANEELLSGSEELQSLNEELETSKEELQSTNEELMTINQELFERSEQYNQARLYTETIVKTIHEPLVVLNKDLRIKSSNKSFYKNFQLGEDDTTGKIIFELQEGQWDIPGFRSPLLKIQSGKKNVEEWEISFPFHAGGEKIFYVVAQSIEGPSGEQLILMAFEDITLQKKEIETLRISSEKVKKELQLLEAFFVKAPAGFCILKEPGHLLEFANPYFISLIGKEVIVGKKFTEFFPADKRTSLHILDEVYTSGNPYMGSEIPVDINTGNGPGKSLYLDINYQALKDEAGNINGINAFFYDVTEKVTSRMNLEAQAEELERQVIERTQSLKELNTELLRSNKGLEQFASIASHDLQEPLRKVQTFVAVLLQKHYESVPEKVKELIDKIDLSTKRMTTLIRDVLNYSKLAKTDYVYSATDLNKIFQQVIKDYNLTIKEKSAKIKQDPLPVIEAIPAQMTQLFYNLLGNALKFSNEKEDIIIHIETVAAEKAEIKKHAELNPDLDYIKIIFRDNGIGFDPEFSEQIFLIFQRLNNISKYPGTGIGLALCQNILFAHHGAIWATSNKKEGTAFHMLIPIKQALISNIK